MKKRFLIRIVSYFSVAVFIAIGFWRVEYLKTKKYQQIIENRYAEALSELSSGLNQISLLLEKAGYTTTPSLYSGLATELYSVAELSKNSLSVLPHGDTSLDTINRFLSQVGNFSLSVSEKMINEQEIDEITLKNLSELSDTAETIRQAVMDTDLTYNNSQYWAEEIESQLKNKVLDKSLANSLTELEQNLSDYPTLIYDGPFSDHILTQKPLMITGQPTVNKDEAKTKAEKFCKTGKQVLQYTGMEEGKIPTFRFEGKSKIVTVTKEGGEILYFRDTRAIDKYVLNEKQAIESAKRFLSDRSLNEMQETYYFIQEGVCTVNFAYMDGQTLCYTDLIKVGVALDNGDIVSYEASGYLFHHTTRAFEIPKLTAMEAAEKISPQLTINSSSIVLIPTDGGEEKRCYEFLCNGKNDREILVYVDVMTGLEEQILILMHQDNGILVK